MTTYRVWISASWLRRHPSDADTLITARAVERGVPDGVSPRHCYSPWRKAYLYTWEWPAVESMEEARG